MLSIAICDDDRYICGEIEKTICDYEKTCTIKIDTEVFYSGEELIRFIKAGNLFDLIFLDIELGKMTGVEVGNQIRHTLDDYTTKIVFITSKNGYEQQLFDVQPLNFLRKPIDTEKLVKCINLAIKLLNREEQLFRCRVGHEMKQVQVKEIMYFESKLRKIRMVTQHEVNEFYSGFEEIKMQLPSTFICPHVSYIVNYNHVKTISGETILMNNGITIPISKRNLKEIHALQIRLVKELHNATL